MDGQEFYETVQRQQEMEESMSIAAAFVKAQKAFAPALKSSTNPHFKSKYADLAACVEAVIDALHANGIALIQLTHECDNGVIVETQFLHESGERMSGGKLQVPADKQNPQGYGSALTYARRYSLMAACGIAPEDDDGNAATQPTQRKTKLSRDDLSGFLDYIDVAETVKALTNLYHQAQAGGADESQMETISAACAARKAIILGSQA